MKNLSECSWKRHDGNNVELTSDLQYENNNYIIRVYAGFVTNGGSLPRISWSLLGIFPYSPECVLAFFCHDFLYDSHLLSRKISDGLLYEVLQVPPACSKLQSWLIWIHVRLYGWIAWQSSQKSISEARKFGEITRKRTLAPMVIK